MLANGSNFKTTLPSDIFEQAWNFCLSFDSVVLNVVRTLGCPKTSVMAAMPCNLLFLLEDQQFYIAFTSRGVGGLPTQTFLDRRRRAALTPEEVIRMAEDEYGVDDPDLLMFNAALLNVPKAQQIPMLQPMAEQYTRQRIAALTRPRSIQGYQHIQPWLDHFSSDHPKFDSNVFVAMRFRQGKQFAEIRTAIAASLAAFGLKAHWADDKTYPPDGDLWNNICVYMMGCKYAICVFEEIDDREFNPNVPLEYGFLRAMDRQVLLLKDSRMGRMPSDMTGKLYRHFDTYDITATITEQITQWAERDLGLKTRSH